MDVINGSWKLVRSISRIGRTRGRDDDRVIEIGAPTSVSHVTHVTFDRFQGFLGLPDDFQGELPARAPSASRSVFGVRPETLHCSYDAEGNQVPDILLRLQALLYDKNGLQTEGIFRVAAQNDHEDWIREQVNMGLVPENIDVHAIAGLIKAWFRELPEGLLDRLHPNKVAAAEKEEQMLALVATLPGMQAGMLEWVVGLMADVVQQEARNKMNAHNIAVVFAPNMTQVVDPLIGFKHVIKVMDVLRVLVQRKVQQRIDNPPPPPPPLLDETAQDEPEEEERGEEADGHDASVGPAEQGGQEGGDDDGYQHQRHEGGVEGVFQHQGHGVYGGHERGDDEVYQHEEGYEEYRDHAEEQQEGPFSDECMTPVGEDDRDTPIARPLVPEPLLPDHLLSKPLAEPPAELPAEPPFGSPGRLAERRGGAAGEGGGGGGEIASARLSPPSRGGGEGEGGGVGMEGGQRGGRREGGTGNKRR
ncbi:hypothetical protein CLOM_g4246 [Closterium sp. NIES-68]|nr:hypothetical protein CLOM_g4246 [Closterium sp. NIES-68]